MFLWGLLLLAQATNPVVTKLVMEPECLVLGVEQPPHPDVNATIRISPKCKDKESKERLLMSALSMLFKTKYRLFTFEEKVLRCSKSGYVDVRLTVKEL